MAAETTRAPILELEDYVDPKNIEQDSIKVILHIKPDWENEEIKFKPCPGAGFLNTMLICHIGEDLKEALIIRVFGEGMDYLMNKKQEIAATKLFHEIGVSPTIYCFFKNGVCMEFVKGTTYSWADLSGLRDIRVPKAVARELAKVHCHTTGEMAMRKYGDGFNEHEAEGRRKIKEFIENWPTSIGEPEADKLFKASFPSLETLKEETSRILAVVEEINPTLQICHSDANPSNVIYIPEEDRAILIDYDFSGFNYAIVDLATFIEFSAVGLTPDIEGTKRFSDDYIKEFLREYLVTMHSLGDLDREVMDEDVENLFILTMKAILGAYLLYSMAFIFLALERERHGVSKKDMVGISCIMSAWYFKNKDSILAMETPQLPWTNRKQEGKESV